MLLFLNAPEWKESRTIDFDVNSVNQLNNHLALHSITCRLPVINAASCKCSNKNVQVWRLDNGLRVSTKEIIPLKSGWNSPPESKELCFL